MNAAPALAAGRTHRRRLHDFRQQAENAGTPPDRSHAQRMQALGKANRTRTWRAQLKRDLKAGRASIRDLILEPPPMLETAKVADYIRACRKYGPVKTNGLLRECRMSPSKTFGGLSPRQRAELAGLVHENSAHDPREEPARAA